LQRQAHAAAAKVGVKNIHLHNLPDNRLDTVPLLDVVKIVEDLVERIQPQVIYTHHAGDLNVDHGVIHRAVLTATRPIAGQPVREIYAFEVPSSTEWAFQRIEPAFRPNVVVDITGTIEAKVAAMECYESEARAFPHPRSPEALRAIATRWGERGRMCGSRSVRTGAIHSSTSRLIMPARITIGRRTIGPELPAYIVAEVSANHHQKFDEAVKIIHAANDAGADAIKLQTYTADTITIACDRKEFRLASGTIWDGTTLYELYGQAYTPWGVATPA